MESLTQYELTVNNQLMGIMMSGTVVITVVVLMLFYYFYVERTRLVRYLIYYFFSALVGLLASSFLGLMAMGRVYSFSYEQFYAIAILGEYFSIYTIYLLTMYLLRLKKNWLSISLLLLLPVFNVIGYESGRILIFSYVYILVTVSAISVISVRKGRRNYCIYAGAWGLLMLAAQLTVGDRVLMDLQWVVDLMMAILLVVYFIHRYRDIYEERKKLHSRLTRDAMTGARSKSYFYESIRNKDSGLLLFIDINQFKWINDTFGHVAGDRLLTVFASYFKDREDIVFARFGGDEFTIYYRGTDEADVAGFCTVLKSAFEKALESFEGAQVNGVGISIGAAVFEKGLWEEALSLADEYMYRAKDKGNNLVLLGRKGARKWIG